MVKRPRGLPKWRYVLANYAAAVAAWATKPIGFEVDFVKREDWP